MNANIQDLFDEVKAMIDKAYDDEVTMQDAEKIATRLLSVQMVVSQQLRTMSLCARMRKSGLKAVKASAYLDEVKKHDKKPSDSFLEHTINLDKNVNVEQDNFDHAEVEAEELETMLQIFKDAHIHFRTIAKGAFNG